MTKPEEAAAELMPCPFCKDPMEMVDGVFRHVHQTAHCPIRQNAWHEGHLPAWNTRPEASHTDQGELVEGYTYDDWSIGDDGKVRIGDFVLCNFQDHNGDDRDQIVGQIIEHPNNQVPVLLVNLVFDSDGKVDPDEGDYAALQSLFMSNYGFSRISDAEAFAALKQEKNR